MGKPYHWRDWCIARGRDCLYIWSDAAALELSNGSNGWFRFILDGKLATMYSSGSTEGGSDSSENRGEFLDKLQRVRAQIKPGTASQPVLTAPASVGTSPFSLFHGKMFVKQETVFLQTFNGITSSPSGFIFVSDGFIGFCWVSTGLLRLRCL